MEAEAPDLPVEVIRYILSFLSTSDRKEASLVSRAWYAASLDRSLQKNILYNLQATCASLESISGLGRRQSPCLALSNLDGSTVSKMVIQSVALHLAPHLEKLSLRDSNITETSFMALIPSCRNLRGLDIGGCNSLFMPGTLLSKEESKARVEEALADLRELDLSNLRYLSDSTFNRLAGCTPGLQTLSLAGCHITIEFDPYRGTQARNSTAVLSLNNILHFVSRQAAMLKGLDFSRTGITNEAMRSLVQVAGLRLEGLVLQHCKDFTDDAVCAICAWQPGLATLDLTGCTELTGKSVEAVASSLRCLERLSLGKVRRITDRSLRGLAAIPTLRALDLSECYQISGGELVKGLASPWATVGLASLNLSCCTMVNGDNEPKFSRTFGNMGFFAPPKYLDDKPRIVTVSDMAASKEKGTSLSALTCLKELSLTACTKLTDTSITKEIRFEELKTLSLSMVRNITDESIASIAMHCRSLERLFLSHCSQLTDHGMIAAMRYMKRLTHLDISCCDKITDQALEVLSQECKWLKSLDVSMCSGLTIAGIKRIQLLHPTLTSIQARYLGGADLSLTL
uniref:F-box/LRR-repeat protein 2 isoform X2 n=1 Tax=Pristiophorus japonicus TaxID=55135 RepID=UPI00398F1E1A